MMSNSCHTTSPIAGLLPSTLPGPHTAVMAGAGCKAKDAGIWQDQGMITKGSSILIKKSDRAQHLVLSFFPTPGCRAVCPRPSNRLNLLRAPLPLPSTHQTHTATAHRIQPGRKPIHVRQ